MTDDTLNMINTYLEWMSFGTLRVLNIHFTPELHVTEAVWDQDKEEQPNSAPQSTFSYAF